MTKKEQVRAKLIELLEPEPNGLKYSAAVKSLSAALPEITQNTIVGTLWNIETNFPQDFYKPSRGVYCLTKYQQVPPLASTQLAKVKETEFYSSFAEYLVKQLEECSKAIPLGGCMFKDKWGTPDVIGVLKPLPTDVFKFPIEIVSAEIKLDPLNLTTAFGQACSYRLFSHRSYIVVPKTSSSDDISRLESLCSIFGIGLIVFDAQQPANPEYQIRTRALRHEPDWFYVNKHLKLVADELLS